MPTTTEKQDLKKRKTNLTLSLDEKALANIKQLQEYFNQSSMAGTIQMSLALTKRLIHYVDKESVLTILNLNGLTEDEIEKMSLEQKQNKEIKILLRY